MQRKGISLEPKCVLNTSMRERKIHSKDRSEIVCLKERDRERETERETERERQRERQRDRDRETETERQRERETERQRIMNTDKKVCLFPVIFSSRFAVCHPHPPPHFVRRSV